jgi:hypothetical protein
MPSELTANKVAGAPSQTHLWGFYDVSIDIPSKTVTAALNRQAMFTANVVNFLNGKVTNLGFHINGTPMGPDYVDVDIDVSITHPFPGLPQYNGYDVRGVFMGDGSASMGYNPELIYPVIGADQLMLADPVDGFGGPDGYTRWFNKPEFSTGGSPLFQYTPGKMASPGFTGTATLNAYRYFADGLGANDDLWTWLAAHGSQHGQFSSGATNTRNYYLRFPNAKGVRFGYAVLANWEGPEPEHHPSNAPEAVACRVIDNSDVFYVDPSNNGGNLILDISLFGWKSQPPAIFIDSTVLSNTHQLGLSEMIPVGGGDNFSTYHVEIPADNVAGQNGNEFWVIAQYDGLDYTNDLGVPNLAGTDPLAAFFRHDLSVGNQKPNTPPVITGITDDIPPSGLNTIVNSLNTAVTYVALFNDPDIGQTHAFKWYIENSSATGPSDPPDSMPFNWAPKAAGDYKIWVKVSDGFDEVTGGPYTVTKAAPGWAWTRTWGGIPADYCYGIALDQAGKVYAAGYFQGTVDFDPGPSVDSHTSIGYEDVFLSKFDPSGAFLWAKTWGGTLFEEGWDVAVDGSGNVYVTGYYQGTVDFDPGPGIDSHPSNGDNAFLSKFDSSGAFLWAKTWGGDYPWDYVYGRGVAVDGSGNAYVTGYYQAIVDFDPGSGVDNHTSNGNSDVFLSKFNSSGAFVWAKTWGATFLDSGFNVALDGSSYAYVTGYFSLTADFDPGTGIDNHISIGTEDAFLSKFDSSGAFLWARTWGGTVDDNGRDVAVSGSGQPYVAGYYQGTADFDPGLSVDNHASNGNYDVFLSKFDSSGAFLWAKTWGGSLWDFGYGVTTDIAGNVHVTGLFSDIVDFDPGSGTDSRSSNGGYDAFLSRFDSSGAFLSAKTWGGTGDDYGHDVAVDAIGDVYATGYFQGTVDFDPGLGQNLHISNGGFDVFLSKFVPE